MVTIWIVLTHSSTGALIQFASNMLWTLNTVTHFVHNPQGFLQEEKSNGTFHCPVEDPSRCQGWNVTKCDWISPISNKNPKESPITKHPNRTSWERVINFDIYSTSTLKVSAEPPKVSKRTQKKTNDKDHAFAKWFKVPKHMALRKTTA